MNQKVNIEFNFALVTFFGFVWLFLIDYIKISTLIDPADFRLIFLTIIHYVIFLVFLISMILLYLSGLRIIDGDLFLKHEKRHEKLSKYLFQKWPIWIILLLFFYLISNLQIESKNQKIFLILIFIFLVYLLLPSKHHVTSLRKIFDKLLDAFGIVLFSSIGFAIYILISSFLFSDIIVYLNKHYYTINEELILSVKCKGYLLNPQISRIIFNGKPIDLPNGYKQNEITLEISLNDKNTSEFYNYFTVEYSTQILSVKKEKTIYFDIIEKYGKNEVIE